ncbi:MAG TPA: hypothetical protein VFO97_02175 [Desertimonas sp.]|nr:hypothetical protein [Desertimonas sp.]
MAPDADTGRRAVLALESLEHADDQLGTVVMGSGEAAPTPVVDDETDGSGRDGNGSVDPEGVTRQVVPRVLAGAAIGAVVGALVVGGGALVFGATGWQLAGAAVAGAMLFAVFGAMWWTFAALGGSDAYRQTFVDEATPALTIVSVHTDDPAEAAAARQRLSSDPQLRILDVDRFGDISTLSDETWTDAKWIDEQEDG